MKRHGSLNRIYRIIWSHVLNAWVAVAENVRGRGKSSARKLISAALSLTATLVQASPIGGQVVSGAGAIAQSGNVTTITQSSQNLSLTWKSFNVGSNETVNFLQPSASAIAVNRIFDTNGSRILGHLNANGQIYLINPNGILFGQGAQVNVGGLVASTLDLNDASLSGNSRSFSGTGTGSVVNLGTINARYVALLGNHVSNQGLITARLGSVALGAGSAATLTFSGNDLVHMQVDKGVLNSLVENGGLIQADGGYVIMTAGAKDELLASVVNNTGVIEAQAVDNRNGSITLLGGAAGTVNAGGTLDASSATGAGGKVVLTANHVQVTGRVDASGANGGGTVDIGGGFQGKDSSIANASQTLVGPGALISADALNSGNGGNVVVWSNQYTAFGGKISARGGMTSGNGGRVEVSSKGQLNFLGQVDSSAAKGISGTLLLDPLDIVIATGGSTTLSPNPYTFATSTGTTSTIDPSAITSIANAGTAVTLQATQDITVNNSIVESPTTAGGALTFTAGRSITVNADIVSGNNNITLDVNNAGGTATSGSANFTSIGHIDAGTGDIVLTYGTLNTAGTISTGFMSAANLTINSAKNPLGGALVLGQTVVGDQMKVYSGGTDITNPSGTIVNIGSTSAPATTTLDSCNLAGTTCGNITITNSATNLNDIYVNANNFSVADTNAVQLGASLGTSDIRGNLNITTYGPIGTLGAVLVGGTTTITANSGGFGTTTPDVTLNNSGNHFTGTITANVGSGSLTLADSGAMNLGNLTVGNYLSITAGAGVTQGAGTSISAGISATINDAGATTLGNLSVGTDLTLSTGAITQLASTTITVPHQTTITAGTANNVTLDSATNNFNDVQIVSSKDATLVDTNAIQFGSAYNYGANSNVSGNLSVTAGGNISQNDSNCTACYASAITVGGTSTFTVTAANSSLLLGPATGYNGQSNNFTGALTLATSGSGTYQDVQLRNTNSGAGTIAGLGGSLRNVSLTYDNASSLTIPGMTLSGYLYVKAPTGSINQSGALVVSGATTLMANSASGHTVLLGNTGNDFSNINVTSGYDVTIVDKNSVNLYTYYDSAYGWRYFNVSGNLNVSALDGNITETVQNNGVSTHVSGTATFSAAKVTSSTNDITLNDPYNNWNTVVISSANNVSINENSNIILGSSTIGGTLSLADTNRYNLSQVTSSTITTGGTTTFSGFGNINLGSATEPNNVFGPLSIYNVSGSATIRENDAITQAGQTWSNNAFYFTTSNDQAINLNQNNYFGSVNITQINNGASSAGAVYVQQTGNSINQNQPWVTHGTTTLNSLGGAVNLTNQNNTFGPLQVLGGQTTNIYAKDWVDAASVAHDAITDVGGTGAWTTGYTNLHAYNSAGSATTGTINLANAAN